MDFGLNNPTFALQRSLTCKCSRQRALKERIRGRAGPSRSGAQCNG